MTKARILKKENTKQLFFFKRGGVCFYVFL